MTSLKGGRQSLPQVVRTLARTVTVTARYGGRRYLCPCCQARFRRLLPYGVPPRPNRACPKCGALQRHRLLWLYLARELHILTASHRVLHIAPERAIRRRLKSLPNLTYVTTDLNLPGAGVQAELGWLPFEDDCFDIVVCSHVLEHIEHDLQSMAEMFRVLAPGGQALIMVPLKTDLAETYEDPSITSPDERHQAFGHPEHVRYYGADVVDRLRQSGFEVEPVDYVDRMAPGEAEHIRASRGELIYVCRS
ncbi:MAG: methyltransferase domain-containing protein [Actinomycetota bacterium]|nr:methyltransferase domain-containing protein [Actinomycetota bacterium]